jgi:hypothetical protein
MLSSALDYTHSGDGVLAQVDRGGRLAVTAVSQADQEVVAAAVGHFRHWVRALRLPARGPVEGHGVPGERIFIVQIPPHGTVAAFSHNAHLAHTYGFVPIACADEGAAVHEHLHHVVLAAFPQAVRVIRARVELGRVDDGLDADIAFVAGRGRLGWVIVVWVLVIGESALDRGQKSKRQLQKPRSVVDMVTQGRNQNNSVSLRHYYADLRTLYSLPLMDTRNEIL